MVCGGFVLLGDSQEVNLSSVKWVLMHGAIVSLFIFLPAIWLAVSLAHPISYNPGEWGLQRKDCCFVVLIDGDDPGSRAACLLGKLVVSTLGHWGRIPIAVSPRAFACSGDAESCQVTTMHDDT